MPQRPILLDASCLLNLYASGKLREIAQALPQPLAVAEYVMQQEALYIRRGESKQDPDERQPVDIAPLVQHGGNSSPPLTPPCEGGEPAPPLGKGRLGGVKDLRRRLLVSIGLIQIMTIAGETEATTFIDFAREMDDGEATTCALAMHRECDVATDDRKARRVLAERAPQLPVISTLGLVKQWSEIAGVPKEELRAVLPSIWAGASYYPGERDPLYRWWATLVYE